jgi:cellulose synthase/poly-beta-1,6-N-acetylglucosamine synthase-like glycosyltransferase
MIDLVFFILSAFLTVPVVVLFFQVLMAVIAKEKTPRESGIQNFSLTVLVPAHNEEVVIRDTIHSIKPQLGEADRLIVVADNCTDKTAQIVKGLGVEVLERDHPVKRSKGYALDYGIRQIRESGNTPDVLIVIDADCLVENGALRKIAEKCVQVNRPVQALDLMYTKDTAGLKQKISEFAWLVKNLVRPLGYLRLGFPCQLMGTGMAFPWKLLSDVNLANDNIVEDMKLGIDLTRQGYSPVFFPDAKVTSFFPENVEGVNSQRTRWEHGHLSMVFKEGPSLFYEGLKKMSFPMIALAIDLMIPPLALLSFILILLLIMASVSLIWSGSLSTFVASCFVFGLFVISILLAWFRFARSILTVRDMLSIPWYILSKLPLYIRFITNRQKSWLRTSRDK